MSSFTSETSISTTTTTDDLEYQSTQCNSLSITSPKIDNDKYRLIQSISFTLENIISHNLTLTNNLHTNSTTTSPFSSTIIPGITLYEYLLRICAFTQIENETLITAFIYIDRVCSVGNEMLNEYNVHRILFTSVLLAIKYNEDIHFTMEYYAGIAGISVKELFELEYAFTCVIDYCFYICDDEFTNHKRYLLESETDYNYE
jgi:hypothetical protein